MSKEENLAWLEYDLDEIKKQSPQKTQKSKRLDVRKNIDQMAGILTQAGSVSKPMFYEDPSQNRRLEFTHQSKCVYSRHQKVAYNVMLNPNTRCFTSYNDKELVVWNPMTEKTLFRFLFSELEQKLAEGQEKERLEKLDLESDKKRKSAQSSAPVAKKKEKLDLQKITCLCYSKKMFLYFAFTTSNKLIVLNEYLNIVSSVKMQIRTVQKCFFIEETEQLVTAGVQGCHLIQLKITFKYEARRATILDTKGDSITVEVDSNRKIDKGYDGYFEFEGIDFLSISENYS